MKEQMKEQMKAKWKVIGYVGVDAGALMISDPCYWIGNNSTGQKACPDWGVFCGEYLTEKQPSGVAIPYAAGHVGLAVAAPTAHGDGLFPVYGLFVGEQKRPSAMLVVTDDIDPALPEVV